MFTFVSKTAIILAILVDALTFIPAVPRSAEAADHGENFITRTATLEVQGTLDEVFPLFTAAGELTWLPGWDPTYIYPASGVAQTGASFSATSLLTGNASLWYTIAYDPETHYAEYLNIDPTMYILRQAIRLESGANDTTQVEFTFDVTLLSEEAITLANQRFNDTAFQLLMAMQTQWLNYGLEHGEPMAIGAE